MPGCPGHDAWVSVVLRAQGSGWPSPPAVREELPAPRRPGRESAVGNHGPPVPQILTHFMNEGAPDTHKQMPAGSGLIQWKNTYALLPLGHLSIRHSRGSKELWEQERRPRGKQHSGRGSRRSACACPCFPGHVLPSPFWLLAPQPNCTQTQVLKLPISATAGSGVSGLSWTSHSCFFC